MAWRTFMRGLAVELEAQVGPDVSRSVLHGIGRRMAGLLPLVGVDLLEALQTEINVVLAGIGWGHAQLSLLEAERCVAIVHTGLPRVSSAGDPPGTWLGPLVEGLYEGWMGHQPGADSAFRARIGEYARSGEDDGDRIIIRYGR